MRGTAGTSKTPWATVDAGTSPCTSSGASCAPGAIASSPASAHISVEVVYLCAQDIGGVFRQDTPEQCRRFAKCLIEHLPTYPIPETVRLGRTLRKRKDAFLAYFDTGRASNGPTEAINGIIELGQRTDRGYRNYRYRLRMLLVTAGLDASTHTQL